jgi:catechol 2,3-dioxygenase-like lactoylglutathione lyase family enzyme
VVRRSDDPDLPPSIETGSTLRETTFGVRGVRDLEGIGAELAKDRDVTEDADGTLHAIDPLGFPIAFPRSRRMPAPAPELKFNTPGHPDRINTRGQFFKEVHPLEMTHTVFMIDDPDKIVPFYVERLGFIVSDCYPGRGYFLRGGASNHHHDLFLINVGKRPASITSRSSSLEIHELFGGGLNMTRRGWRTALGPGRHPISSCYFWYFHNPSGGAAEYDFDSDVVDASWKPGSFEQTPELLRRVVPRRRHGRLALVQGHPNRRHDPAQKLTRTRRSGFDLIHEKKSEGFETSPRTKTSPAPGCSTLNAAQGVPPERVLLFPHEGGEPRRVPRGRAQVSAEISDDRRSARRVVGRSGTSCSSSAAFRTRSSSSRSPTRSHTSTWRRRWSA